MKTNHQELNAYSIIEGGLFRRVQMKLGVDNHQVLLAVGGICLAWLPLVIITWQEGTLYEGVEMPFIKDVGIQARFLIALPVLILIRTIIHIKSSFVVKYMTESLLNEEAREKMLSVTLPRMRKLACSSFTELVLLLFVVGSVWGQIKSGMYGGIQGEGTNWQFIGLPENNTLNLAGQWTNYVSISLFRFLLLQWTWRYIVWIMLMYRFSKAGLILLPTHPDRSGGIGILILAQRSFAFIFVAGSLVLSGQLVAYIIVSPGDINVVQQIGIGYIILCLLLLILPMLFFIDRLVKVKQMGLLRLSQLGALMSDNFERDWLSEKPFERRLEEQKVDPSMAYDYASMFDNLQQLRVLPVIPRDIASLALTIALPFVPILFVYYSAAEVLQKIVGLLM